MAAQGEPEIVIHPRQNAAMRLQAAEADVVTGPVPRFLPSTGADEVCLRFPDRPNRLRVAGWPERDFANPWPEIQRDQSSVNANGGGGKLTLN